MWSRDITTAASALLLGLATTASAQQCGEWPMKPCSTDKRYNPHISFKLKKNAPVWRDLQGFWKAEFNYNDRDGRPLSEQYVTRSVQGLQIPFRRDRVQAYFNNTVRGTRFYQHVWFVYEPASEAFCNAPPPDDVDGSKADTVLSTLRDTCGEVGYSTYGELYGVASDEKDGTMEVAYARGYYGDTTSGSVDHVGVEAKGEGVPVDNTTMYFSRVSGTRLLTETIVFTNDFKTRASVTGATYVFDDSAYFSQHPLEMTWRATMSQIGEEDFLGQIVQAEKEAKVPPRYTIPVPMVGPCIQRLPNGEIRCPEDVIDKIDDVFAENDPKVKPNEYQEDPVVKGGVIAGFTILAVAVLVFVLIGVHCYLQKKQAERYKHQFARRVAQTIRIEGGHATLTPEALAEEFKRIDEDKSGFLDREELRAFVMSGKAGVMNESDFNALFAAMDVDGSGQVDFAEFCAFLSMCGEVYDEEEGKLSKEERKQKLMKAANRLSQSLLGSSAPGKVPELDKAEGTMKNEEGMA